ncbi:MAG: FtsX-like permease family protein [Desulfobacteraceae bacterium]|nr:MAG: FtsX-like permease family protein [Desulfobacteraceae bacterium]
MHAFFLYLRLFAWFSLRNLRGHTGRALAVLLGIALGAAVFTSVRLAVHATVGSFARSMDLIAGSADATLVQPGGRVPDALVAALLRHPAVRSASPLLSAYVRPAGRQDPFLLIGFDPLLDRDLRGWTARDKGAGVAWSALMSEPYTLLIGRRLAEQFDWQAERSAPLVHAHNTAAFKVLAVLDPSGLALFEGGRIALCDIATFQEFTGAFGQADRIDLLLKPDLSPDDMASLRSMLPAGVVLNTPAERKQSGLSMIRAYQFSLTFLSFVSLFVGMFLVYSLTALNAAARRRELAVLRSTGASGSMLFYLFIGEGALLGLCGWLLALPIGSFLVKYLLAGVSRTVSTLFVRVQVDELLLSPWEILLSLVVTLGVAVLAALQPAREAMRVPPREALDIEPTAAVQPQRIRKLAFAGLGLLALVYPVSRLPSLPAVSLPGYLAALLLFVGFALLAPWGLRQSGRLLGPALARLGGPPAFLAARYLRESGVQTAISVSALITAVALFTALVIMIHSFRGTVAVWVQQSIAGDLYIRPKLAELNHFRDPLPASVQGALQDLKAPVDLVPMRRMELSLGGHAHVFEAMDYAAYRSRNRFIWLGGDPRRIEADLIAGRGVAVSEVFANSTGLAPGDRYQVHIRGHELDEPILGVFRDFRTQGGAVYYSLAHYRQRFGDESLSAVQINFRTRGPGKTAAMGRVRAELLACCGDAIELIEGEDLRRAVLRIFDETFAITTVLLLIALAVAALGIATALTVLVLQRGRQLNTLRAVGAGVAQLRRMIFWEAGLIVVTGQAAGLLCGFLLSYLLIFVVNLQSFGWTFDYRIDWQSLVMAVPLIFAAALLAALPAVKLALRGSPAVLLRGEGR